MMNIKCLYNNGVYLIYYYGQADTDMDCVYVTCKTADD